jgi:tetratricopeptide (TPR) repeat protein
MKLVVFVCLLLIGNILYATSDAEIDFQIANNFFLSGDYQKSIELYEKLVAEGYSSETLFYNLGNAYYRIGKIGLAILYYEKAKALSPFDEDINHNLNFVKLQTKDKIENLPSFFLFEWWEATLNFFTSNQLTIIAYIFFVLVLMSLLLYLISKNVGTRRIGFYAATIASLIFLISIVLLIVKINRDNNTKFGIITAPSVVAKFSPDPSSKESFIIHEGLKVKIEDKVDNWYKIRLEDGKVGWVDRNSLGVI